MARSHNLQLRIAVLVAAFAAEAKAADLRGRIECVGLSVQGIDHYRVGSWTPVLVELTNEAGDRFNGRVEIRQTDRDGDQIVATQEVSVAGTRPYYLYVPGGVYKSQHQFVVRVFDEEDELAPLYDDKGQRIDELAPPREIRAIPDGTRVILDISRQRVVWPQDLSEDPMWITELLLATGSVAGLPDNVAGLEMVDVVVWDAPDPSEAQDPARLRALTEWTKRGGTLILGVADRQWQTVRTRLADMLPDRPPQVDPDAKNPFSFTRRPYGRGEVVVVAGTLPDVLSGIDRQTKRDRLHEILSIHRPDTDDDEDQGFLSSETDLFRYVEGMTGFQATAGLYFLFAFVFVILYIIVATMGSWTWLQRKNMIKHAWVAFALIAILASGVSLAAVQLIRGFRNHIEEFTVVDGRAGSYDAVATSYFGLRTPAHTFLDLVVPTDWQKEEDSPAAPATLRPLPANPEAYEQSVYAAGEEYQAVPVVGELRSVPLRATLKQFEAVWSGTLDGRLTGSLRRGRHESGPLNIESWIENDLGTPLDNCYLLVARRVLDRDRYRRPNEIVAYPVGKIASGERVLIDTVMTEFAKQNKAAPKPQASGAASADDDAVKCPGLDVVHNEWLKPLTAQRFRGRDEEEAAIELDTETFTSAMLLLSTFDKIDMRKLSQSNQTVMRSQGRRLDRSLDLTNNVALFIGFSRDPGPARLCWRKPGANRDAWRPIHPSRARVMYRIAIPIAR